MQCLRVWFVLIYHESYKKVKESVLDVNLGVGVSMTVSSVQSPLKAGSKDALLCQARTLARHLHMLSQASTQLDFTSASTIITQL